MLKIYNSLIGEKTPFVPIDPESVRMYVCGMTVYDYCHLGHARVLVAFDVVARWLRASGYPLTYVRNVTDVDDKIIQRARQAEESCDALTGRFIAAMNEDAAALGVLPPDEEPRATRHMGEIIAMIETLVNKGYAYVGSNGDVFYDVSRFESYGELSGRRLEDMLAGARVDVDQAKTDPLDFVLWKLTKPGEPSWSSPWGDGRPGWHIECSAMSTHCLGNHFDIHGGGMDLKFPHHENEIAQSEAATGETFVNTWIHVGFVQVNEEKMAKSLGNFVTIRDVLARYPAEALRFLILSSHYRSPLNYAASHLESAQQSLKRFYVALRGLPESEPETGRFAELFKEAMDDDFNTPRAISVLFDMVHEVNRLRELDLKAAAALAAGLRQLAEPLGLLRSEPDAYLQSGHGTDGLTSDEIDQLILARSQARMDKNWAEADRIRDELVANGVVLEDGAEGTVWRRQ